MQASFRIEAKYRDIEPPLEVSQIVSQLQPLLPARYSPLTRNGTGVQGYLFGIPAAAGQLLLNRLDAEQQKVGKPTVDAQIENGIRTANLDQTTKKALVDCRVGQGQFRDDLIEFWKGRCAITGADLIPILRASHIKPWRDSNNFERLDVFNGLLLTPNYDAAFDKGLISFNESGEIIFSKSLTASNAQILGLIAAARLSRIEPKHLPYLQHHCSSVFEH